VEVLAEIGVILLLFTIGIEFSIRKIVRMRRAVIGGGMPFRKTCLLKKRRRD
jgi:CPA2 family monovalent cation:H+ antiporter-2